MSDTFRIVPHSDKRIYGYIRHPFDATSYVCWCSVYHGALAMCLPKTEYPSLFPLLDEGVELFDCTDQRVVFSSFEGLVKMKPNSPIVYRRNLVQFKDHYEEPLFFPLQLRLEDHSHLPMFIKANMTVLASLPFDQLKHIISPRITHLDMSVQKLLRFLASCLGHKKLDNYRSQLKFIFYWHPKYPSTCIAVKRSGLVLRKVQSRPGIVNHVMEIVRIFMEYELVPEYPFFVKRPTTIFIGELFVLYLADIMVCPSPYNPDGDHHVYYDLAK